MNILYSFILWCIILGILTTFSCFWYLISSNTVGKVDMNGERNKPIHRILVFIFYILFVYCWYIISSFIFNNILLPLWI